MSDKTNSDVKAKKQFIDWLKANRYTDAKECPNSEGADVKAKKDGEQYYFEIKKTGKDGTGDKRSYFGAATLTEWKKALDNEGHYFFIIAIEKGKGFDFYKISPKKFFKYSAIPPYKVYFNIGLKVEKGQLKFIVPKRKKETVIPNETIINNLFESRNIMKQAGGDGKDDRDDRDKATNDFELLNKK